MSLELAVEWGLVLGLKHASEADHVCTIASLVQSERGVGDAARTAGWWGLGHSLTFLGVGAALVALDARLPDGFDRAAQLLVALAVFWLGFLQWKRGGAQTRGEPPGGVRRTLGLGVLHGLAGTAGMSLLAMTSMRDRFAALAFLAIFAAGTVVGMLVVTLALAGPLGALSRHRDGSRRVIARAAGAASMVVGSWLLITLAM